MVFCTKFIRPESVGELNDGSLITERLGYISAEKQIKSFMYAGINLANMRASGEYGYKDFTEIDSENDVDDFTLNPEFDDIDAFNALNGINPIVKDSKVDDVKVDEPKVVKTDGKDSDIE